MFVKMLLLLCVWSLLFIGGLVNYTASWLIHTIFSVVFLVMLISGLYRQDRDEIIRSV